MEQKLPKKPDRDEALRRCRETDPYELCQYLVQHLLPSLKELYEDHKTLHKAVVRLEWMQHFGLTSDQVGGAVVADPSGDPPDPNSPPSGPPAFPPD